MGEKKGSEKKVQAGGRTGGDLMGVAVGKQSCRQFPIKHLISKRKLPGKGKKEAKTGKRWHDKRNETREMYCGLPW